MDREPPSEDGTKEVNFIRASENRADILTFRDILKEVTYPSEPHEKQFEEILVKLKKPHHARMRLAWTKEKANMLFDSGQYQESIALYKDATKFVLGEDTKFLALEADNEGYKKVLASKPHINVYLDLIFCFDKISEAYLRLKDRSNVSYKTFMVELTYKTSTNIRLLIGYKTWKHYTSTTAIFLIQRRRLLLFQNLKDGS